MARKNRHRTSVVPSWRQVMIGHFKALKPILIGLIFLAGAWGLDRLISQALRQSYSYLQVYERDSGNINQAVMTQADAYILGSSRAKYHFDPNILGAATGLSFFNAGADGQDIFYVRIVTDLIQRQHKPRLYVLNLSYADLMASSWRYQRLHVFAPYMEDSALAKDLVIHGDRPMKIKYAISFCYRYNSRLHLYWINLWQSTPPPSDGFDPLPVVPYRDGWILNLLQRFDRNAVNELVNFIVRCRSEQIGLIIATSPQYRQPGRFYLAADEYFFLRGIREIAKIYDVPLIELTEFSDPFYHRKDIFNDHLHLNARGADYFSRQFARHLQAVIKLPTVADLRQSVYSPAIDPKDYPIPIHSPASSNP